MQIKTRSPLKVLLLVSNLLLFGCGNSKQKEVKEQELEQRPNIIFILVDDLGKEWISSYGAEDIITSNIDALAKSGTKFNNVYSMPQCTPTRVTLLTGQYPFRHGWVNHWDVPRWGGRAHYDERVNPALGMEMKKAGYSTCIAGKWQIDDFRVEPDALEKSGFDAYCMWTGYEAGIEESAERYQNPYIYTKGGSKTYDGRFGPDVFKDFIIDFLKEKKDKPMFVYYPMVLTHTPFVNTPDETADGKLGKHKAMVRYADKITGEIIEALEKENLRENTIVVWTTDNGTTGSITGNYRGRAVKGGKTKTLESGICEPFIVSWPGHVSANRDSDALVDFTDIFPTFLDVAGSPLQGKLTVGDTTHIIDGKSFMKVLLGETNESEREWIMGMGGSNNARLTEKGVENQYKFRDRVLRNERYKLYIGTDIKPEKFFDLEQDPFEENNLLITEMNESQTENLNNLSAVIDSFPEMDNDPNYIPNPPQPWDVEITAESETWKS